MPYACYIQMSILSVALKLMNTYLGNGIQWGTIYKLSWIQKKIFFYHLIK